MRVNADDLRIYVIQARPKTGQLRRWRTIMNPIDNGVELFVNRQMAIDEAVNHARNDRDNGYRAQPYSIKGLIGPLYDTFLELPTEEARTK